MNLFRNMVDLLGSGEGFVLATILARSGSAPRATGTRMMIRSDGRIHGSIGGGILEAQVQDLAKAVFRHREMVVRDFHLSADDASRMGMICGGQVQVLIHLVDASEAFHLGLYQAVLSSLEKRKRAWLITRIPAEGESGISPGQALYGEDRSSIGSLDGNGLREIVSLAGSGQPELVSHGDSRFLVELLCHEASVFIFGAGHISQKLAPLTKLVGFRTIVLDDREEFANRRQFADADQVIVLDAFASAIQGLDIDAASYLVLVTRGHAYDKVLLAEALRTKAGYIGMIGSRRKRDAIYAALTEKGFSPRDFDRVHSPVGLDIGAETPEEIAVSIVAQLVQVRAGKNQ
jgi:xanthine dehydrogenase accessory factor